MEINDTSLSNQVPNLQSVQLKKVIQVQKNRQVSTRVNTKMKSKGENSFENYISIWFHRIQNGYKAHIYLFYLYPIKF